jgi:hypothetical protein
MFWKCDSTSHLKILSPATTFALLLWFKFTRPAQLLTRFRQTQTLYHVGHAPRFEKDSY